MPSIRPLQRGLKASAPRHDIWVDDRMAAVPQLL